MVTGYEYYHNQRIYDFHYYIQHNDGTWSSKCGANNTSNLSLSDYRIITNENILTKANQMQYLNGNLRFFKVTKNTVIDTTHYSRDESISAPFWPLNDYSYEAIMANGDEAGDYLENAKTILPVSQSCKIDYAKDHDCFFVPISSSRYYQIYTNVNTLKITVMSNTGNCILQYSGANMIVPLDAGSQYYIEVYNTDNQPTNYILSII